MTKDQDPYPQQHYHEYKDSPSQGEDSLVSGNFTVGIIVIAVVFHVFLFIIVCYFSCCRKYKESDTGANDRRPLRGFMSGPFARRHSIEINLNRSSQRRSSNRSSGRIAVRHASIERSQPPRTSAEFETRPVTSWQTSLLTRVRNQLGRLSSAAPPSPPPYGAGHEPNDEGLANPAIEVEEERDLPSYQDYLQSPPPWLRSFEAGCFEDKPPSYEDVVKEPNAK